MIERVDCIMAEKVESIDEDSGCIDDERVERAWKVVYVPGSTGANSLAKSVIFENGIGKMPFVVA